MQHDDIDLVWRQNLDDKLFVNSGQVMKDLSR